MIKEPVVPIATALDEAVAHFGVKGKVKITDDEAEGEFCRKTVKFVRPKGKGHKPGLPKIEAPFVISNREILQDNRPHSLRKLVRNMFGKTLRHLILHGANFKEQGV